MRCANPVNLLLTAAVCLACSKNVPPGSASHSIEAPRCQSAPAFSPLADDRAPAVDQWLARCELKPPVGEIRSATLTPHDDYAIVQLQGGAPLATDAHLTQVITELIEREGIWSWPGEDPAFPDRDADQWTLSLRKNGETHSWHRQNLDAPGLLDVCELLGVRESGAKLKLHSGGVELYSSRSGPTEDNTARATRLRLSCQGQLPDSEPCALLAIELLERSACGSNSTQRCLPLTLASITTFGNELPVPTVCRWQATRKGQSWFLRAGQ